MDYTDSLTHGHCTASQYSAIPKHRALLTRTNQKFHHNFSVFECMKIAQNYAEVSLPSPLDPIVPLTVRSLSQFRDTPQAIGSHYHEGTKLVINISALRKC